MGVSVWEREREDGSWEMWCGEEDQKRNENERPKKREKNEWATKQPISVEPGKRGNMKFWVPGTF